MIAPSRNYFEIHSSNLLIWLRSSVPNNIWQAAKLIPRKQRGTKISSIIYKEG